MKHYSVMLNEAIEGLNIKDDGVYVDATLGYAGHSREILKRIKEDTFTPLMRIGKRLTIRIEP